MTSYKKVIVVDSNDNIIGAEDVLVAKEKGLLRRASRVFVFNESGQLLVQRRGSKVFQPLRLDQSVGGHVDEGETYREAAEREMKEELGLEAGDLEEIVVSYRSKQHFNAIYRTVIPDDQPILFDPNEVAEVIWYDPMQLSVKMKESPEEFTESFPTVWHNFYDRIVPIR